MKQCRYLIPGLALSFMTGYALSLLVPIRSLKQMFAGAAGEKNAQLPGESQVQQNDPYIEGLVRELHADQFAVP